MTLSTSPQLNQEKSPPTIYVTPAAASASGVQSEEQEMSPFRVVQEGTRADRATPPVTLKDLFSTRAARIQERVSSSSIHPSMQPHSASSSVDKPSVTLLELRDRLKQQKADRVREEELEQHEGLGSNIELTESKSTPSIPNQRPSLQLRSHLRANLSPFATFDDSPTPSQLDMVPGPSTSLSPKLPRSQSMARPGMSTQEVGTFISGIKMRRRAIDEMRATDEKRDLSDRDRRVSSTHGSISSQLARAPSLRSYMSTSSTGARRMEPASGGIVAPVSEEGQLRSSPLINSVVGSMVGSMGGRRNVEGVTSFSRKSSSKPMQDSSMLGVLEEDGGV